LLETRKRLAGQAVQLLKDAVQLLDRLLARDNREGVIRVESKLPGGPVAQPDQREEVVDDHVADLLLARQAASRRATSVSVVMIV
jgi:hypothetical protein